MIITALPVARRIDEIIGNVDKNNCKSLQNVNPTAFKNIIEMLNAIDGNGQEFKEEGSHCGASRPQ